MLDPILVTSTADDVLLQLNTSRSGLSDREASERRKKYGLNAIRQTDTSAFAILLRQFKSSFVYLLIAAGVISLFFGEYIDSAIIFLFLAINTALGFYQEYKSENSLKLLRLFIRAEAKVLREGINLRIPVADLVPGDIVELTAGDIIPADVRIIESRALTVDESVQTGESVPVIKTNDKSDNPKEAVNIGYSGTTIVSGKARGVVAVTGERTSYSDIARLVATTVKKSVFEKEIDAISKFILILVGATLVLVFAAHVAIKEKTDIARLALFSVALAVSVIPEALPLVTTFSLSLGAIALAKQKVVVKRLSAIEDLGSIEVLCSDKTGTLTENKLRLTDWYGGNREDVIMSAALGIPDDINSSKDPFSVAILEAVKSPEVLARYRTIESLPFDPEHRRTTTLLENDGRLTVISLGAPETITALCQLADKEKSIQMLEWVSHQGHLGRRVLAVARINDCQSGRNLREYEEAMEFIGMVAFADPIKLSTIDAIAHARKLGVRVKILTGDSREVSATVAREIGLVTDNKEVISGEEFDRLDYRGRKHAVGRCLVFARVTPAQKHEIVEMLESSFEVGFLGEGINDAPALKAANVAIAVAGASDIAREASDIVLLEKSLEVIVNGIRQGRSVFVNTTKYITATLSANFGNFFAVVLVSLLIPYLPMLPLQILLLNLLSDFPMIAVSTDSVDLSEIRHPQRYYIKKIAVFALLLGIVSTVFDFLFFAVFSGRGESVLQTNWFIGSVLTELAFLFAVRTRKFLFFGSRPFGPVMILSLAAALLTIAAVLHPASQKIFHFLPPTVSDFTTIGVIVILYIAATEGVKRLYYGFRLDTRLAHDHFRHGTMQR